MLSGDFGFVLERFVGAKKITGIEKVSAAGEPAPEGLRHHAVADRSEVLPASASESLVSPHRPMSPPHPTGRLSCDGWPAKSGGAGIRSHCPSTGTPLFICWTGELSCAATELFPCQDLARG